MNLYTHGIFGFQAVFGSHGILGFQAVFGSQVCSWVSHLDGSHRVIGFHAVNGTHVIFGFRALSGSHFSMGFNHALTRIQDWGSDLFVARIRQLGFKVFMTRICIWGLGIIWLACLDGFQFRMTRIPRMCSTIPMARTIFMDFNVTWLAYYFGLLNVDGSIIRNLFYIYASPSSSKNDSLSSSQCPYFWASF